mgnify:CR=1 FL=1
MGASNFRKKLQDPVNLFSFQDIIIGVTGILIMFTLILILSSQDSGRGSAGGASKEQLEKLEKMQKKLADLLKDLDEAYKSIPKSGVLSKEQLQKIMDELKAKLGDIENSIEEETSSLQAQIKKIKNQVEQIKEENVKDSVELGKLREEAEKLRSIQTPYLKGEDGAKDILVLDISGERCEWFWKKSRDEKSQFPVGDIPKLKELAGSLDATKHQVAIFCRPSGVLHFRKYRFLIDESGFKFGTDSLKETELIKFED